MVHGELEPWFKLPGGSEDMVYHLPFVTKGVEVFTVGVGMEERKRVR